MRQIKHVLGAVVLGAVALAGCGGGAATKPAAPVTTARVKPVSRVAVQPKARVRMAVLPVDPDRFPRLAAALSQALGEAKVSGVDEVVVAKAPLEVVQISIECIEASPECWTQAGRSLEAGRVLFARLVGEPRKKQVSATVTLFDVDAGVELKSATRTWASEDKALPEIAALVAEVTGP